MGLTGLCIFNPHFNLVIVEGSAKGIKQYSRLMTARINWTEAARARDQEDEGDDAEDEAGENVPSTSAAPPQLTDAEAAASLKDNKCDKVWEGPLRDRAFKGFRVRNCPTDNLAKDALGAKWSGTWEVAKTWTDEDALL